MKKKDPVLWVVFNRYGQSRFVTWPTKKEAICDAEFRAVMKPSQAPFRVVKYLPAPKTKKRKNAK